MKQISAKDALVRLETLCARSEQSTGEAREKLRRWGILSADAEKIIDSLVDRRFIDNARFARAFARDKIRFSKWGRIKVSQKLREKVSAATLLPRLWMSLTMRNTSRFWPTCLLRV